LNGPQALEFFGPDAPRTSTRRRMTPVSSTARQPKLRPNSAVAGWLGTAERAANATQVTPRRWQFSRTSIEARLGKILGENVPGGLDPLSDEGGFAAGSRRRDRGSFARLWVQFPHRSSVLDPDIKQSLLKTGQTGERRMGMSSKPGLLRTNSFARRN